MHFMCLKIVMVAIGEKDKMNVILYNKALADQLMMQWSEEHESIVHLAEIDWEIENHIWCGEAFSLDGYF